MSFFTKNHFRIVCCIFTFSLFLVTTENCSPPVKKSESEPEPQTPVIETVPQEKEVPEPILTVFDNLSVKDGSIGWSDIYIGARLDNIQAVVDQSFQLEETMLSTCGGGAAEIRINDRYLWLQFSGMNSGAKLESMLVAFKLKEMKFTRDQLIDMLKSSIPDLIYQPSRHKVDVKESENPSPVYLLSENQDMAILLKPDEGIYIAYGFCLD